MITRNESDAGLTKAEIDEWNLLAKELMDINDRMSFVLKRMKELDGKVIKPVKPKELVIVNDEPKSRIMTMNKGNSFVL